MTVPLPPLPDDVRRAVVRYRDRVPDWGREAVLLQRGEWDSIMADAFQLLDKARFAGSSLIYNTRDEAILMGGQNPRKGMDDYIDEIVEDGARKGSGDSDTKDED